MRKLTLSDRLFKLQHPLKKKWVNEFGNYMDECTKDLEYIEPDGIFILTHECVDNCLLIGSIAGLVIGVTGTAAVVLVRKIRKSKKEEPEKSEEEA